MMILTSDEAKTKDCCSYNQNCKGDQCMAWVEHFKQESVFPEWEKGSRLPPPPPKTKYIETGKGFCGMMPKR